MGDLGTVAVDTTAKDSHFRKFPNRNYQPGPRYAWLDQSAREFSPTPQRKGSSWDEREAPASPATVIDDADAIVQDEPAEVVITGGGPHALAALSALSADHSLVKSDGSERTAFSMTGKEGSPQGGNKGMRCRLAHERRLAHEHTPHATYPEMMIWMPGLRPPLRATGGRQRGHQWRLGRLTHWQ